MRILITRPLENAISLARRLENLGHVPLVDSLLRIVPLDPPLFSLAGFQALITTSQYAIQRLAALAPHRDIPLWCVGGASAEVANNLGFKSVMEGGGSASALVAAVAASRPSSGLSCLYLSGSRTRVDVVRNLAERGIAAQRVIVYKTQEAESLAKGTMDALRENKLDAILFYSPRSGWLFQKLCRQAGLEACCSRTRAVCLSTAIGEQVLGLPWKNVEIAKKPTTDDLLMALMMAN